MEVKSQRRRRMASALEDRSEWDEKPSTGLIGLPREGTVDRVEEEVS